MAGRINTPLRAIAIVPARYSSSRLPGKPLVDVAGVPLILRVLRGLEGSVQRIIAATDDSRIAQTVTRAGFEAVITDQVQTGTQRVLKAWESLGCPGDTIINVQGDEPLVNSSWIKALLSVPAEEDLIVTLARREVSEKISSPDSVSVVTDQTGEALYFSRYPIPYGSRNLLHHIGVYCFSPDSLRRSCSLGSTELSRCESLEQLAWLENGLRIRVMDGEFESIGVDTPFDLERAVSYFEKRD